MVGLAQQNFSAIGGIVDNLNRGSVATGDLAHLPYKESQMIHSTH
jgi:hypothetical protein